MLRKNKKVFNIAVAVIALIALSSLAYSQCCSGYWNNNYRHDSDRMGNYQYGMWNNMPDQYKLSSDQVKQINKIRTDYRQRIMPLMQEMRSLRTEYRGYASRQNADVEKIKQHRLELQKLQNDADDMRLDARDKINNRLSKEQRGYFNSYGLNDWWDHDMDGDMMMVGGEMCMMDDCRYGDWW
jgi:Spy/CpxP family protein refolding chaperone